MAIYEFRCQNCGRVVEVYQRDMNPPDSCQCPDCGELAPRKMSRFGFEFSQGLKELRSTAYIKGTNIKVGDIHKNGLIPAAKGGDAEAIRLLGGTIKD